MKLQLKKDSILLGEHKTIKASLWVGGILLFLGAVAEFLLPDKFSHKDFVENILLGGAASSFISFITLYIPFKTKMEKEEREFKLKVRAVYAEFVYVYELLKCLEVNETKEKIKKLKNEVYSFKCMCDNMDFTSENMQKREEYILETMTEIIEVVTSLLQKADLTLAQKDESVQYTQEEKKRLYESVYNVIVECVDEYDVFNSFNDINHFSAMLPTIRPSLQPILDNIQGRKALHKIMVYGDKIFHSYMKTFSKMNDERMLKMIKDIECKKQENEE